jgi:NAD(P)-dependent dehydrogenase (short-subunit alcohol dehydrogenase family)
MKQLLEGKIAVVTGGGRGIGEAIAKEFAEHGSKVIIADISDIDTKNVAESMKKLGHIAMPWHFDVTDFINIKKTIRAMWNCYGVIDIWVNNAGITEAAEIESITEEQWDRMQNIDLKSVFFCTQAVFNLMKGRKYGKLVHVSSMAGQRGGRSSSASYSAAKAGVINLSKSFAINGGAYNITSNTVCPGRTITKMAESMSWLKNPKDDPKLTIPLGRFGTPEDIAHAALFYASDLSCYITGDIMAVNGGLYI